VFMENCPGRVIPIEIHVNGPFGPPAQPVEPMYETCPTIADEFVGNHFGLENFGASSSLSCSVDKGRPFSIYDDTARMVTTFDSACALDVPAKVALSIDRVFDETTGMVEGTVHVLFETVDASDSGDMRIGIYVIEDSVTGSDPNYSQYSEWDLPLWPTPNYIHPDVLRAEIMNNSLWGKPGVLPDKPVAGVVYDVPFSYTLPALYYDVAPVPAHISLAAFVAKRVDMKTGTQYNAAEVPLVGNPTAINAVNAPSSRAFSGHVSAGTLKIDVAAGVSSVDLFTVSGRLVRSVTVHETGVNTITLSGLVPGRYVAKYGLKTTGFVVAH